MTTPTDGHGSQPRSLIVTIYGLYAREDGGWISVAALIRLMAELGVDEPAVRSSISRLKRRDMLHPARSDGAAGYALTERAREVLRDGDARIFGRPAARVEDGWLLAVFSVPERERQRRHLLRSRLTWLGFGTAAPGVWVAPAHVYAEVEDALRRHGLTHYVDLFRADYLAFGDLRTSIASWWDLAGLQASYDDFVRVHRPVLARWRRRGDTDEGAAFADYVRALTHWRRLPFLDPGLPVELLPSRWHGARAAELFQRLQDRLSAAAARHVAEVTAAQPRRDGGQGRTAMPSSSTSADASQRRTMPTSAIAG